MFKINYRITDALGELKSMDCNFFDTDYLHISGFIEIRFGEHWEGCYYHENPLQEGEFGSEYIDYWLDGLLDALIVLPKTRYAAVKELETVNRWMEFKLLDETVMINVAIDEKKINNKLFITEPFDEFNYVIPMDFSVKYVAFTSEIKRVVNRFLDEIRGINPKLLETRMGTEMASKLKKIER